MQQVSTGSMALAPRWFGRWAAGVVGILGMGLVVACGEAGPQSLGSDRPNGPAATSVPLEAVSASGAPADESDSTPGLVLEGEKRTEVFDLLGWSRPDDEALRRRLGSEIALAAAREDVLVACMAAEGFDYFPLPQGKRFGLTEDPDAPRGSKVFTERYGFGVSTLAFPLDMVGPDALGFDPAWIELEVPSFDENPNASYLADLDEAGRVAYGQALGGGDGGGGCRAEALARVPEPSVTRIELAEQLDELDERVAADGGFILLAGEVDQCMQVDGFTFTGYGDMEGEIRRRLVAADLASDGSRPPVDLELDQIKERLLPVQEFELGLAAEFERCSGGFTRWHDQVDEIAESYRADFLSDHSERLGL